MDHSLEDAGTRRCRWLQLVLVWLVYGTLGLAIRSLAPLVTPILADLGMSNGQMGLVLGAWQAMYIVVAVFAGFILDRWGARRAILAGIFVVGCSLALRSLARGLGSLLPAVALLGVGGPLVSIGAPKLVSEWFEGRERGLAVGIYATGPIIGSLIALSATHPIVMPLASGSWRTVFLFYGGFAWVVSLLWLLGSRDPPGARETAPASPLAALRELIGVREIRILLAMGVFEFALVHGVGSWLPKLLENAGLAPSAAGYLAALPMATGIAAILAVPRLTPPVRRGRVVGLFSLACAVLVAAIPQSEGGGLITVLVLYGLCSGSLLPLLMLLVMDTPAVRVRGVGSAAGMFFCAAEIGGVGGPVIMGLLSDATGSLASGMYLLSGCCFVLFLLAGAGRFSRYASGSGGLPSDATRPPG